MAEHGELPETCEESGEAITFLVIECDGFGFAWQDLSDQRGEYLAGARLDECGDAIGGHGFNDFPKADRTFNLCRKQVALAGIGERIALGRDIGVDRKARLPQLDLLEGLAEWRHCCSDNRRMEG